MALRIIQISDCHLPADPATAYRGQDAGKNLEAVWHAALRWKPDLILLTGDLSEDASPASYDRLRSIVRTEVPVLAIPGNHDEPEVLRKYFDAGPWDGPLAWSDGDWRIVLTDSTLPRKPSGRFSAERLEALAETLNAGDEPNILIALHHQPVAVDSPWIDRFALEEPEGFLELLDSAPRLRCVIWGHVHQHFMCWRNGVLMLGAPSTAANSRPGAGRFELDPVGPGCRTLELESDGTVRYGQIHAAAQASGV